ncbi:hypothetical protein IAT40_007210 [Kwoniella sp. CBS 6097]
MAYYDPRQSMYSPPPANAPEPPPRPSSAYDPYPERSQPGRQSPLPPPRPSSACIAPFPGQSQTYHPPSAPPTQWTQLQQPSQPYGNQGDFGDSNNNGNSSIPFFQPQPLPALSEPQIEPPPRTTSLHDPYNIKSRGEGGYNQDSNYDGSGYGNDDTVSSR